MSTVGREADDHARQLREIRKRAEAAAEEYPRFWLTSDAGVRIERGDQVIRLTNEEAKRLARGIPNGE